MPISLQDMFGSVPSLYIVVATLMVVSMENKWYYFLLLPLAFCWMRLYRLHRPFNIYTSQQKQMYWETIVLVVVLFTMLFSVGSDPDSKQTFQVVLRSILLVIMTFLSFVVCFSSPLRSVYMRLWGFLLVFFLFIFSLTFIIHDEPMLRKGLYVASVCIMSFFLFYYWRSLTLHLRQDNQRLQKQRKKREQQAVMAFDIRQLPTKDGLRSRRIA